MTDIVERLRGLDMKRQILSEAADEIEQLRAVLEKIATLRYSNTSAASIAQSALDTMKALEK